MDMVLFSLEADIRSYMERFKVTREEAIKQLVEAVRNCGNGYGSRF